VNEPNRRLRDTVLNHGVAKVLVLCGALVLVLGGLTSIAMRHSINEDYRVCPRLTRMRVKAPGPLTSIESLTSDEFVAVGEGGLWRYNRLGEWEQARLPGTLRATVRDVATSNVQTVAAGYLSRDDRQSASIWFGEWGGTWQMTATQYPLTSRAESITFHEGHWIVGGIVQGYDGTYSPAIWTFDTDMQIVHTEEFTQGTTRGADGWQGRAVSLLLSGGTGVTAFTEQTEPPDERGQRRQFSWRTGDGLNWERTNEFVLQSDDDESLVGGLANEDSALFLANDRKHEDGKWDLGIRFWIQEEPEQTWTEGPRLHLRSDPEWLSGVKSVSAFDSETLWVLIHEPGAEQGDHIVGIDIACE
jgi:hypothetical protein